MPPCCQTRASEILRLVEACNPVAWPETLVSLVAKAKLECTQKRKFRCLPLCSVHLASFPQNAFPKSSLPMASFSSHPFVFLSSFVCAANPVVGNSVVHSAHAHPSHPMVQRSIIGRCQQQMPLPASAARAVFVFTFLSSLFFFVFVLPRKFKVHYTLQYNG